MEIDVTKPLETEEGYEVRFIGRSKDKNGNEDNIIGDVYFKETNYPYTTIWYKDGSLIWSESASVTDNESSLRNKTRKAWVNVYISKDGHFSVPKGVYATYEEAYHSIDKNRNCVGTVEICM